ncbi:MAG: Dna2/Cas4 domain-containing protein, partial [Bacteroidetes bacterium]|nr:Dna2/Cas4 domain-containing protein [Bacteroidota bacterium]
IHKSKGLEFDVVLVPYLSGEVQKYNDLLWSEPNPPHPDFPPLVPVPFSGKLKNSMFREKWEEETLNQWLDALNLLYVTFTRPRRMLEVWSPLKKDNLHVAAAEKNYSRIESMLLFALHELQPEQKADDLGYSFCFGEIPPPEIRPEQPQALFQAGLPQPADQRLSPSITILGQSSEEWEQRQQALRRGLIVHRLAAGLDGRPETTEKLIKGLMLEGLLEESERSEYLDLIHVLLAMPVVQETFDGSWQVLNEQAILLPDGRLRRPDRVAIRGNEVRVIDYKTGSKKEEHHRQIQDYMRLLQQLGLDNPTGYLVYLDEMSTETVNAL